MKSKAVVKTVDPQEELSIIVARRRKALRIVTQKVDALAKELSSIEEEYEQRVGTLQRKNTILEKEIHLHRQIRELMKKGVSYEDAIMQLQKLREESPEEVTDHTFDVYDDNPDTQVDSEDTTMAIRKMWKKLVQQFHPDRATSPEERREREEVMKKINNAYREQDYKTLKILEEKGLLEEDSHDATEQLALLLQDIENAIIRLEKELKKLKQSQWFFWRKKTQKEKNALFIELERDILREVLRKEVILDTLKKNIGGSSGEVA